MEFKKRYKYSKVVKSFLVALWCMPFFAFALAYFGSFNTLYLLPLLLLISLASSFCMVVYWFFEKQYEKKHSRLFNAIIKSDIGALINETKDKSLHQLKKYKLKGMSLLELALQHNSKSFIVHYLLYKDMLFEKYPSDRQNLSYTLLYLSINYTFTDLEIVKLLIEKGALVNEKYNNKLSLLQIFCIKSDYEIVSYLIKQGADIHHISQELDLSVIMIAAKYCNNATILELLIEKGAKYDEINRDGYNCLLLACEFNKSIDVVSILLSYNINLYEYYMISDRNGKLNEVTPLYLSALNENKDIITLLIRFGYEVNYVDSFGMTPLFIACLYNKNPEIAHELLKHGAFVNARDKYENTPLMAACYMNDNHIVAEMLIKYGADKNAVNGQGFTYVNYLNKNKSIHKNSKQRIIMLR